MLLLSSQSLIKYNIREGGFGYIYMEITSPIYDTMVSLYPN